MEQLGTNAHGDLEAGRSQSASSACALTLPTTPPLLGCWWVTPAALLHPVVPQPHGVVLYELLTGHPDPQPQELVLWRT